MPVEPPFRSERQSGLCSASRLATPHSQVRHGFLPKDEALEFCLHRQWDIYPTRDRRRRIYDMFLISTELDWLEIRLHQL